jgi:putative transposase
LIKCKKIEFRTTKTNLNRLYECNRISAQIWNNCIQAAKEYSLSNSGKWINNIKKQHKNFLTGVLGNRRNSYLTN